MFGAVFPWKFLVRHTCPWKLTSWSKKIVSEHPMCNSYQMCPFSSFKLQSIMFRQ